MGTSRFNKAILIEIIRDHSESIEDLSFETIRGLVKYMNANQGGMFLQNEEPDEFGDIYFELTAMYAYDRKKYMTRKIKYGEGLVGICAIEKDYIYLTQLPEDYINITSGLGDSTPTGLILVPIKTEENVLGVIEIASFNIFKKHEIEFLQRVADSLAITLSTVRNNSKTEKLLIQTKEQAEELKAQEEEMRQNLEELKATQDDMSRKEIQLEEEKHKIKQENKEFAAIFESLNNALMIGEISIRGKFMKVNREFCKTLELNLEEVVDQDIHMFISNDEKSDFERVWQLVLNGKTRSRMGKRKTKSGKNIWLKSTYAPIFGDDDKVEKILYIAKNITHYEKNGDSILSSADLKDTTRELKKNLKYFSEMMDEIKN